MKTILYIYGYGSNENSSTYNNLKELLSSHKRINIISIRYSQENPQKALQQFKDFIEENQVDMIVASSLGAYIAIQISGIPKILINPCVHPEVELEKLQNPSVPEFIVNNYKNYITNHDIWSNTTEQDKYNTTVIIGKNDELFGQKYVQECIKHCTYLKFSDQGHSNTKESLETVVIPTILNWFNIIEKRIYINND